MDVIINLALVEPNYEVEVNKALDKAAIPNCIGNMILPPLDNEELVNLHDITKRAEGVDPKEVAEDMSIDSLMLGDNAILVDGLVLTKEGLAALVAFKTDRIKKHVAQAVKCVGCAHTSKCYMLTQNALAYIAHIKSKER
jgi:hypothetical protein